MKELIQNIILNYQISYAEKFKNNLLAERIRTELPHEIEKIINNKERYWIKGSPGKGNWTTIPWVAIFDVLITRSAQTGFYPVYLFRDDMSGFYLSLNQGVTEFERDNKKKVKERLRIKAEDYRAQYGSIPKNFQLKEIKLKRLTTTKSRLPELYECGNIIAKFYSADAIPTETVLRSDLLELIEIYNSLVNNNSSINTQIENEYDEEQFKGYEDLRRFRQHKRVERNQQLSKKVKKIQGYVCKTCGLDFEKTYGKLGRNFIEAHHLRALSDLDKDKVQLDARTDFVVLCSNCHSMIHRLDDTSDIALLKEIINTNRIKNI